MTDASGGVVLNSQARYEPFGDYIIDPDTDAITDQGFTGHQHNDEIGLIYMNARYYVPELGRFASADSIVPDPSNPQSFNRYSYVYNNPMMYNDPTGNFGHILAGGAIGGLIGGGVKMYQNHQAGLPLSTDVGKAVVKGAVVGGVGAATFGAGTMAGGSLMAVAGVSTGSGITASVAGGATITAASVLAGQSARITSNVLHKESWNSNLLEPSSMVFDATLGIVGFRSTGGKFQQVAPSNVFATGRYARGSSPATGAKTTTSQRATIQNIGAKSKCHHCGKSATNYIGDHIPPTSCANGMCQRLYPQCRNCMKIQSHNTRWPNSSNANPIIPMNYTRPIYGTTGGSIGSTASSYGN